MRQVQFPLALAHGLEAVAVEIGEGFAGRRLRALEQRQERLTVDIVFRGLGGAGLDERGDDVDVGGERVGAGARVHDPRPAHDERDADAAFEGRALAFTERSGRTGMTSEVQPRSVVAGEHDDRVVGDALVLQRLQHGADGAVDVGQGVGVGRGALALEIRRGPERGVRHRGGEVQEERLVLAGAVMDEAHRAQPLGRGERVHVRPVADETHRMAVHVARELGVHLAAGFVADGVSERPHVVRVRQDHRIIEAMIRRHELRRVAEMPLADHAGVVPGVAEQGAERLLVVAEPRLRLRAEGGAAEAEPVGVATRHQRGTGRSAHGLGGVEAREAETILGQTVDVRREVLRRAIATGIGPAHVVAHDVHHVRPGAEQGSA